MHNHSTQSVLQTPAGYYVGIWCPECGPWSRDSPYMGETQAQELLAVRQEEERLDAEFAEYDSILTELLQEQGCPTGDFAFYEEKAMAILQERKNARTGG